jgi:hypothetical protein
VSYTGFVFTYFEEKPILLVHFSTTVALFIIFIGSRPAGTSTSTPGSAAHADSASSSSSSSLSSAGALEKNDSRPSSSGTTGTQDPDTDDDNSDDEETNASAFATFVGDGGGASETEEKNEGERDEDALQAELANAAQAWSQDVLLPGGPLLPGLHIATLKWHSLSQLSQMIREVGNCSLCDSSSYEQMHIEQKNCIHQSDHHLGFKSDLYVLQQRSLAKERKHSYLADGKSVSHVLEAKYRASMESFSRLEGTADVQGSSTHQCKHT